MKSNWIDAITKVLEDEGTELNYRKITELIFEKKLLSTKGETPDRSVNMYLHADIRENGRNSIFLKTGRGCFILRKYHSENKIYPTESSSDSILYEGASITVIVNRYERNNLAREKCIDHFGAICQVCDEDFGSKYGEIGEGYIDVHHKVEISSIGKQYQVDPINHLVPVCPNCHSMLHKKKPPYTVPELKAIIENQAR